MRGVEMKDLTSFLSIAIGGVIFEYIEPRLGKFPVKMNPWIMKWTGRLVTAFRG